MSDDTAWAGTGSWADLTIWGVSGRYVLPALTRMAFDRRAIRRAPGLRFAKLLGTGSEVTFAVRDADPHHWALLSVWNDPKDAAAFRAGPVHAAWRRIANEQLNVSMVPIAVRGRWSGVEPFVVPQCPAIGADGPVAAVTRARLRPSRMPGFWRAVPPIAAALHSAPGLVMALSMGEAPIGLAGTFSLWSSQQALTQFARRTPAHVSAIRRTGPQRWYAEELFARFAVRSAQGRYRGQRIDIAAETSSSA